MPDFGSIHLMFAQDNQPLSSSGSDVPVASPGGTVAPGGQTPAGGGTTAAPAGNPNSFLLLVGLVVAVMLIFSMLTQRKERKRREATLNAIKKHDRVQTIGGVIGLVVEIKPDYVVLKVDESSNTRITFSRAAVQQVLTSSNSSSEVVLSKTE
jgi:preprotein translocase subunit YajC